MKKLLAFLLLPKEITDFERSYLRRVNRIALALFATHVPAFALIAWLNHTGALAATLLTTAVLMGPAVAVVKLDNPRTVSVVHGVASMFFGGLLVHFGQGPVQIEMHFYFFSLLAMCAVFGNPMVVVAAAATVAVHHLIVWLVLPSSIFNYNAAWWVVAVHAAFVVLESTATCYIARSFFDNVIELDRIVQARTAALDARNRDMRLLLDNVQQGFLTIARDGTMAPERSAAVDGWFGRPRPGMSWLDWLEDVSAPFGVASRRGWVEVVEDVMPVELTLDQMPHRLTLGSRQLRVDYQPIGTAQPYDRYLVMLTDETDALEHERSELERRETMVVFEHILSDRSGTEDFFEEGTRTVRTLTTGFSHLADVKRMLHTLKGNAAVFGLDSVAEHCHALEDAIVETGLPPSPAACEALVERWGRLTSVVERIAGHRSRGVEVDAADYAALESAVARKESYAALLERLRVLRCEPAARRLTFFADQARRIAARLDKGHLEVAVEDNDVRVDSRRWAGFWSSFIHAIRNAVDHGLETPSERLAAGKPDPGRLVLRARQDAEQTVIEISDDGRGINWTAIRERALRAGLLASTREDLERALFADGVSTAETVTDVSGRGVGMGALAEGARLMGGTLTVESTRGVGTTVRATIPRRRVRASLNPAA